MRITSLLLAASAVLLSAAPAAAQQQPPSEETIAFFKANCASCHTIGGGRLTGPDLKGVAARQDRDWLIDLLMDPRGVVDSGDPYARQLLEDARGVYMNAVPGMTRERAGKLLDLVAAESELERSQFAGMITNDRPLTAADVVAGAALFQGSKRFAGGAPACAGCHSAGDMPFFGGGRLGPDLTAVYARMEGRNPLAAWLSSPPSVVMQPVYGRRPLTSDEILQLVAFFKDTASHGELQTSRASLDFLLVGFGVAALILALFDFLWRNRFRSVRRSLLERSQR
ncbi:MAG TPA: c-type cytochrome [Planctomycetota bacterium]